jgi:hypothetical protein
MEPETSIYPKVHHSRHLQGFASNCWRNYATHRRRVIAVHLSVMSLINDEHSSGVERMEYMRHAASEC